jgi:hypothetical protein
MTTVTGEHARARFWDVKSVAIVAGMLVNIGALVWGAATIKSTVDQLGMTMTSVVRQIDKMNDKVGDHDGRLRVLEDRERPRR